jgi:flagellar hook-basal body complex protein FliE
MRINPVSIQQVSIPKPSQLKGTESSNASDSFGSTLKQAVGEVNHLQTEADNTAVKLATGELTDVHEAMLAMQKASMALQFTVQVRNKIVEAYQEIMRTQV